MITYWTATWGVGFATPYLVDETAADLGVNIIYLWLGMVILSLVWAYLCVPELSGLSIREVCKPLFLKIDFETQLTSSEG